MYKNLKALRQSLNMTQKEFASSLGIGYTTYNGYETGVRDPKSDFWVAVAQKYNVTIDYLMGYSDDPRRLDDAENAKRGLAVIKYLREMGFTVTGSILKSHHEDIVDESGQVIRQAEIADEFGTVLSKGGLTATFTDAEFEELQAVAQEAIEGRFYKKVLEQQKK